MPREVYCLVRKFIGSDRPHYHLKSSCLKFEVMIDLSSSKLIWALSHTKNLARLIKLYTIIYKLLLSPWLLWRLNLLSSATTPVLQYCAPVSNLSDRTPLSTQLGRSNPHFHYYPLSHCKFYKRRILAPQTQWCLKFPHPGLKAKSLQNRYQVGALATPLHLRCHVTIPTSSAKSAPLGHHSSRLPSKMQMLQSHSSAKLSWRHSKLDFREVLYHRSLNLKPKALCCHRCTDISRPLASLSSLKNNLQARSHTAHPRYVKHSSASYSLSSH